MNGVNDTGEGEFLTGSLPAFCQHFEIYCDLYLLFSRGPLKFLTEKVASFLSVSWIWLINQSRMNSSNCMGHSEDLPPVRLSM